MNSTLETELEIILTAGELWFMLEQFSPTVVLGLENPYFGWLAEEKEAAERQALASLLQRDLVRMVSEREISLDQALAGLIGALARANHSLIIQLQRPDGTEIRRFVHFGAGLIVELLEQAPKQFRLTALPDRTGLAVHLRAALHGSSHSVSKGAQFQLPEAAYQQARELAGRGQAKETIALLQGHGLPDPTVTRLHAALTSPVASSSVVVLVNRTQPETQHVHGFAVLEGQTDMWILQPSVHNGQTFVTFTPAGAAAVQQRFLSILP